MDVRLFKMSGLLNTRLRYVSRQTIPSTRSSPPGGKKTRASRGCNGISRGYICSVRACDSVMLNSHGFPDFARTSPVTDDVGRHRHRMNLRR